MIRLFTSHRLMLALAVAGLAAGCATTQAPPMDDTVSATVTFPDEATAKALFTYDCDSPICPYGQAGFGSLEEAVEHYMGLTVRRDGYPDANVDFSDQGGQYVLTVKGSIADDYGSYLQNFLLENGGEALSVSQNLVQEGRWLTDKWGFFLTLGLAVRNPATVQVLHFPPDTVPDRDHDYLKAATTQRWARMLGIFDVSEERSEAFQSIVDVAPIAAPASEGGPLGEVIGDYTDYSKGLIDLKALPPAGESSPRPLVVFGSPARSWFHDTYQLPQDLYPMTLASVELKGTAVPVLGANHPSAIFYQKPHGSSGAMQMMRQDLVAACWQAKMGDDHGLDPATTRSSCYADWYSDDSPEKEQEICNLYWQTTFPSETPTSCTF